MNKIIIIALVATGLLAIVGQFLVLEEQVGVSIDEPLGVPLTIEQKITNKPAKERHNIKGQEIAKVDFKGTYIDGDTEITILNIKAIEGGVEILAKAKRGGKSVGFGKDGSVEIERFNIYNPPVMVDDPNGDVVREWYLENPDTFEMELQTKRLREDPAEAMRQVIAQNIALIAKENTSVVEGKIGNTTSTFYPDDDPESTTVDGMIENTLTTVAWDTNHDTDGSSLTTARDTDVSDYIGTRAYNSTNNGYFERMIILFDTSTIGSDTIDSATLSLYMTGKFNEENDGDDYFGIVQSSPASDTALVTTDFNDVGDIDNPDTADEIDITSITEDVYTVFTFNATGEGWIDGSGITRLGVREGHDIIDSKFTAVTRRNIMIIGMADTAGTTQDPKLVVEHSADAGGGGWEDTIIISKK